MLGASCGSGPDSDILRNAHCCCCYCRCYAAPCMPHKPAPAVAACCALLGTSSGCSTSGCGEENHASLLMPCAMTLSGETPCFCVADWRAGGFSSKFPHGSEHSTSLLCCRLYLGIMVCGCVRSTCFMVAHNFEATPNQIRCSPPGFHLL